MFFSISIEISGAENTAEHEESLRCDAATIAGVTDTLRSYESDQGIRDQGSDTTGLILTVAQRNLSQLVAIRLVHQTKRAAGSTKTRSSPKDLTSEIADQTDRQQLYTQMAEVVRRAGTGLERDARWRSRTAPGTQGPDETLLFTGNSANAEMAAKERVNTVRGYHFLDDGPATSQNPIQARATRTERFNKGNINLSQYLVDGLVGDGKGSMTPHRLPLKPDNWGFVYWDGGVYLAKGITGFIYSSR